MSSGSAEQVRIAARVWLVWMAGLWVYSGFTVATNPKASSIPDDDYRQYIAGWSSGRGINETIAFLREQARKPGRPLLVAVGGFGRHGNWVIKPKLAGEKGIRFRVGFVDTPAVLAELVLAARHNRVFIVEEPPSYEISKKLLALVNPAPKAVFTFERVIPRLGVTDGAMRVWEVSRQMRVNLPFAAGPAVSPDEPSSIESVVNPNGLEGTPARRFFWIGEGATEVIIRSGRKGFARLEGDFRAGPSVAGKPTRLLLVMTNGGYEEVLEMGTGRAGITVPVEAGRTQVQLIGLDPKDIQALANGDQRSMLIGVEDLRVTVAAEGKAPSPKCRLTIGGDAYGEERMGMGWLRWTSKEVEVRLFTSGGGTVVLEGEYLSSVRPAKIDLSLEGVRVGVLDVGPGHDKLRTFPPLELDLPAGNSTLLMRSNKDGVKPAGDVRVLNFLVANLRAKRKDSQMVCEAPR